MAMTKSGMADALFSAYLNTNPLPEVPAAHDVEVPPFIADGTGNVQEVASLQGFPGPYANTVDGWRQFVVDYSISQRQKADQFARTWASNIGGAIVAYIQANAVAGGDPVQ